MSLKYIRAPKGFKFEISITGNRFGEQKDILISLIDLKSKSNVGHISLESQNKSSNSFATHSYLREEYHGKGLGAKLYAKAIQYCLARGYKVRSSGYSSLMAERVWRSKTIRKYYRIKSKRCKKYGDTTWYAYAKLV